MLDRFAKAGDEFTYEKITVKSLKLKALLLKKLKLSLKVKKIN